MNRINHSYSTDFDAVVVGAGPNGLAAAILLRQNGLSVLLVEAKNDIGGGLRSAELTLPGFLHDVCSSIHPLAVASPFLKTLPLNEFGLTYINPEIILAHPFNENNAAVIYKDVYQTAELLSIDKQSYLDLLLPFMADWPKIVPNILGPFDIPQYPYSLIRNGWTMLKSADQLVKRFRSEHTRALFGGIAAHSIQPLTNRATAAITLILTANGHLNGWPFPMGGARSLGNALAAYFKSLGGLIETNLPINNLKQLPSSKITLFDISPPNLLKIAGHLFPSYYKRILEKYRYGPGIFKVDWALNEPIPFSANECKVAATVHLGNSYKEIATAEQAVWNGKKPVNPFVILTQPSIFDNSRNTSGKHTAWGYCHVPNGSTLDMTEAIEKRVESFAPGFKDIILARHTMNTIDLEAYNSNYVGGDINGGVLDLRQLLARPILSRSPYKTPAKGIYLCSASTPPGGGVHGMCGYHAAKRALIECFGYKNGAFVF